MDVALWFVNAVEKRRGVWTLGHAVGRPIYKWLTWRETQM